MYCDYNIPKNLTFDWVSLIKYEFEQYGPEEIDDGVFLFERFGVKIICHRELELNDEYDTHPPFDVLEFHIYPWQFFEHFENIVSYIRTKVFRDTYLIMSRFQGEEWKIRGIEPVQAKLFFKKDGYYHLEMQIIIIC